MNITATNPAVRILKDYLVANGLTGRLRLLEQAEAHNRLVSTTGNGKEEGVSVVAWSAPRLQLILEITETGYGFRGEGPTELVTLTALPEVAPEDPPAIPPGQAKKLPPATSPMSYESVTREEVAALPGASEFLPALAQVLIDKAIAALQPEEPTPPPEDLVVTPVSS